MADEREIGLRIRRAREEAGLTQQELGRIWGGKSHAAISDIERGATKASASALSELAHLLGKQITDFYPRGPQVRYLRDGRSEDGTVVGKGVADAFLERLKAQRDKDTKSD